jgi:ubiquinone/menaquinone biosynthesis C-methylase UbiE
MEMEDRKQKEVEYYDRRVEEKRKDGGDFEGFNPLFLDSFQFLYDLLRKNCQGKTVLDYGCGNGIHSAFLVKAGAEKVIGIDLSEKSLEVAEKRVVEAGVAGKVEYRIMDCEKLEFSSDSFDVILDGGTFSSLDLEKAFPELARVLKPEGCLVGIETFGHNPFTNLKRKLNKITGKRTGWAEGHIFSEKYLEMAKNYFDEISVYYFHIISWAAFPFLKIPGGKIVLEILEFFDKMLKLIPFLRKYGFKVVFIFRKPKK